MGKKIYVPPIKSQGIKTKLVPWINSIIPEPFNNTWIEPFMGTGVVAFNIVPKSAVLCDTNPHLINFYKAIQKREITPDGAKAFLQKEGALLLSKGEELSIAQKERLNELRSGLRNVIGDDGMEKIDGVLSDAKTELDFAMKLKIGIKQ